MQALSDPGAGNTICVARITGPEMIAAFFRKVPNELSGPEAARAAQNFRTDFENQYRIVEITPVIATSAMTLAERHRLRGYDAVQLAAALYTRNAEELVSLTFVSADIVLNTAAQTEGLAIDDPNNHPQ